MTSVLLLTLMGFAPGALWAQESLPQPSSSLAGPVDPRTPVIAGYVRYGRGESIAQPVLVKLETINGTMADRTWTGSSGRFEFFRLPRGQYVLVIEAAGYKTVRMSLEFSFAPLHGIMITLMPEEKEQPSAEGTAVSVRDLNIPKQARKEYDKGVETLAKKKPEDSIAHFRKAIQLYPDYDDAYLQLGWAQLQQRAYADAQLTLEQALQHNQKNPAAHALLGTVHKQQNRLPQAAQALQQALSLQESFWRAHLELGEVLLKLGQVEQAYPHVARAHELHPALASIHLQLYNTLILRNDYAAAVAELEEFLKLFPEHALVPRVRQQRDALRAKLQASD